MRFFNLVSVIVCGVLAGGCATNTGKSAAAKGASHSLVNQIVAPDTSLVGRVVRVNTNSHFAILNFPLSRLPVMDQPLGVYRNGQKVGELKTTRWQLDDSVVADIVSGECQVGDEVSDR